MKLTRNDLNRIIKEEIQKFGNNKPTNEEILEAIDTILQVDSNILKENIDIFQPLLEKLK